MKHEAKCRIEERFWSKVSIGSPDECWQWIPSRENKRYGLFFLYGVGRRPKRKTVNIHAHRAAFCLSRGYPIGYLGRNDVIRHKCDNPSCVNPSHLEIGTQQDNVKDMMKRDRFARGSGVPSSKLTDESVSTVWKLRGTGLSHQKIADRLGVSQPTITSIISGKTWKHISRESVGIHT